MPQIKEDREKETRKKVRKKKAVSGEGKESKRRHEHGKERRQA